MLRVERRPFGVGRHFDADPIEVADPVDRAVVVDPPGHRRLRTRGAAVEEQQLLAAHRDRHDVAEQLRQPAAARPHDHVALDPRAVLQRHGKGDCPP